MARNKKEKLELTNIVARRKRKAVRKPADDGEETYQITPKGILLAALVKTYGIDIGALAGKLDEFIETALTGLSRLSSNGEREDMFGRDFNTFFAGYIRLANAAGEMKKLLDDNGIHFELNDDEI